VDDTQKKWVIGGLVALLLWWWWSRRSNNMALAPSGVSTSPTPAGSSGAPAPPIIVDRPPALVPTPVIARPPAPPPLDVATLVTDGERDVLTLNAGISVLWSDAADELYRQLWKPASLIPLSNLGPEDWILAKTFLENAGGEMTRRDELGMLAHEALADASQQRGGALAASIIGTVASIIPIVGAGFNAAMQSTSGAVAGSGAWNEAMGNGQLGATIRSALSQPTQQTRHLLRNYDDTSNYTDGPEAPLDRRIMNLSELLGLMPAQTIQPPMQMFVAGRTRFRIRLRLFTRYAGGWVLPWLAVHFNGDRQQAFDSILGAMSARQTVNARARVLRAVDAIICQYSPYTREGAPDGYFCEGGPGKVWAAGKRPRKSGAGALVDDKTVFYYSNPFLGPMLGSIFPPTAEDKRYVGGDGRTYSYYGEPMTGLSSIAVGPIDDYEVDPSNRGQILRATTGGGSM
jgi:hypothetical protein